ncbi:BTB/POZ domain-containing protein 18, partial [Clarias magur]
MLQFEALLLRQLQKQQNRDELCDTVLHTQGVSVPVHSCVLSAFSPRLYGTLSSMPVPMAGQRRLIELQAVDACTLLSLVSLLYSGQFHENREQVLSAAQTLGIDLPQWQDEEERYGEKAGKRRESTDADQGIEKEADPRNWDNGMIRRIEESRRREEKMIRESGTQTECGRETNERGAQTDLACSEPQSIQTVYLIDQATYSTNHELGSYVDIQDTGSALQAIHPEIKSTTCEILPKASKTVACHTINESACVPQISLDFLETSQQKPCSSVTLHSGFSDQSVVVPVARAGAINNLKQFEGNIPGFINYFLDSAYSQTIGIREQGCAREECKEGQVITRSRGRSTDGGLVKESVRCIRGGRRQRCMKRWGLVARLAWQGKGGGRVGRFLETRSTGKISMKAFQRWQNREALMQNREALVEAGEARGRGRQRQRGKTENVSGRKEQNDPPRRGRPRGRPRLRPILPASRGFSTVMPTKQGTVDPTELDLLHTVTPMPAAPMEPIQPIDTLLDDIMTDLHFLPPAENQISQHCSSSAPPISKAMYPNSNSLKPTDPKQHLEGDLNDILDQFLRTFDQHVGSGILDEPEETSQDKFDGSRSKPDPSTDPGSSPPKTYTQLQPQSRHLHHQKPQTNLLNTSNTRPRVTFTLNPSRAENTRAQDGHLHGSEVEKPSKDQNIVQQFENQRITRSQSMKRKLETAFISPQNPVKRKCKQNQSVDHRKTRQRASQGRFGACANKERVNSLDKNNKNPAKRACVEERQKRARGRGRNRGVGRFGRRERSVENSDRKDSLNRRKKRSKMNKTVREACVEAERRSNDFQAGQSCAKKQIGGSCLGIASSAMEKVRMLLQLQDEEERVNESLEIRRVNKVGNGRLVNYKRIDGAKERIPVENSLQAHFGDIQEPENEGGRVVSAEDERQERTSNMEEVNKRQDDDARMADGLRQEELMTEECSVPLQPNMPSNA